METRAPYALIGLFVVAAIAAVFGFVYWLNNAGNLRDRAVYQVRYENTVSGMLIGSAVLFNGIRVGEVTALSLDPQHPRQVTATIAVTSDTPVRADTTASIDFQGLTGVAVVTLSGGSPDAARLSGSGRQPPLIVADPLAGQNLTTAARAALQRLDGMLSDNSVAIKNTLANLNTFSDALARNSQRVDGIVAGIERMTGGGAAAASGAIYDLSAATGFSPLGKTIDAQLTIADPSAVLLLDTQKIVVRPPLPASPTFDSAKWSDSLPKLVQARLVQSFENSKYFPAVARPADALNSDYQLLIDVRAFQIATAEAQAVVELSVRLVGSDGKIRTARVFRSAVPAQVGDAGQAAAALNGAFGTVAKDIVIWTAGAI